MGATMLTGALTETPSYTGSRCLPKIWRVRFYDAWSTAWRMIQPCMALFLIRLLVPVGNWHLVAVADCTTAFLLLSRCQSLLHHARPRWVAKHMDGSKDYGVTRQL